jgi:hypothetical protein
MSKVSDFYVKATADESAKKELSAILGGKKIDDATDEELVKIGELAKKLGFDITVDEAKAYLNGDDAELDDNDLDAVAGGKGSSRENTIYNPTHSIDLKTGAVEEYGGTPANGISLNRGN